ncbi:guanitoxin biosynthesis MBL fold metallo-hydrolase GntH [Ruegeria profundi]|uniref:guanitoxin biosynthesis MBL fold metallo-hydrolase GntH n=1 Tax=Ruegeria profundi TaxID=1685378 RepID=UPI001CD726FC|nr:guanitoxin biosynthesis MBL fold metallo-hydrolase GntH [Ruegeria profundi]MCA0930767.1 MBL fold metallo-hydrolase [Ruegeria profundi]
MNSRISRKRAVKAILGTFAAAATVVSIGQFELFAPGTAHAAGGIADDPTGTVPDRYVYYPGTEALHEEEVRVVACGTGMPDSRRGQASACFLFEFGNGEKLFFDLGTGAMRNVNALMIPSEFLTKVFISHLHTDHWGDLASLWAGGWTAGRPVPLEVWGPSGREPEMGTAYAIDGFLRAYNWDYQTRAYKITPIPGGITVNEFDYRGENEVIYDQNGVVVRSIPAIHAGDGPVSFIIEYAGLKLVYGGDTSPNKWFVEYAKDADFVIHEAFASPESFVKTGQPPQLAWRACCEFHTSGPSFGKIMSEIQPRHAVAYHTFEEFHPTLREGIRSTYDGPLSIAVDMMVWNITVDGVTERMAVSPDRALAVQGPTRQPGPDKTWPDPMSQFIKDAEWGPGFNAQNEMLDGHRDKYGLDDVDWRSAKPWYEPN